MRSATRPPPQPNGLSGHTATHLFILLCLWLFTSLPIQAQDASCTLNDAYPTYQPTSGILHIPAITLQDETTASPSVFQANLRLAEQNDQGAWFELLDAAPTNIASAAARAHYDSAANTADLDGYLLDEAGNTTLFAAAKLILDSVSGRFLLTGTSVKPLPVKPSDYAGGENVFELIRSGADQFLLPVEVGGQTLKLLVDSGSDALLVFEDRLADCNTALQTRTAQRIRSGDAHIAKSYASGTREGVLATTSVRIGAYYHAAMKIMLIQSPDSQNDPSLTAKGADGIIGLRHTAGLNFNDDAALLDAPLLVLQPQVTSIEFNLPPSGAASLAFGTQPTLGRADTNFLLRAKALPIADPNDRLRSKTFADMQVPFRAKTRYGEANAENLDILLDTGAVSRLVLDTQVAEQLGYDPITETWALDDEEEIELNLVGLNETTTLYPKFKIWEVSVAPYSTMGVEFEAVLGISRWQEYIVGFDYLSSEVGEPDGTISLLRRTDLHAVDSEVAPLGSEFVALDGLNSTGNEAYPSTNHDGSLIAFQSDRSDGAGGTDVYIWQRDQGLLPLLGLNTAADEGKPSLSADGRFLAYETNNNIQLYDVTQQQVVDLPNLNAAAADSEPALSSDGRYLAFTTERNGNPDIALYDRQTSSFIELFGVNTELTEHAPALSADGRFLTFNRMVLDTALPNQEVQLYDVQNQSFTTLSRGVRGINTDHNEQHPALHLDSLRLAFHSNRKNPQLGLYDRDLFVVDMRTQIPVAQIGLNSDFDDTMPRFSGDGSLLVFQSRRPGGAGGSDILLYQLDTPTVPVSDDQPAQDIAFTPQMGGQFSAPLNVGDQAMNLLVEMNFNALLVFRDSAAGLADSGQPVTVTLGSSQINGTLASADVRLGQHQALNMQIVIADRSACEAALFGLSTNGMDGILGLSSALPLGPPGSGPAVPLQALQPTVGMWEVNFGSAAGLTLGQRPATSSNNNALHTGMDGVNLPGPGAFTDIRIPFVGLAYSTDNPLPVASFGVPQGDDLQDTPRAALTTLLNQQIILTPQVAQGLGYDASTQSWGTVQSLDLNFLLQGSDSLLPVVQQIAVSNITVAALDNMDALVGLAYWQRYTLGIDYPTTASNALLFLADNNSSSAMTDWRNYNSNQFIPLSGLNSIADEESGSLSVAGRLIAFQSNRNNGDLDIYVWHPDQGLLDLPGLNSSQADINPSLSADGRLLAFESTRNGQPDVFVYDLQNARLIDLPGLNTAAPERNPALSGDGTTLSYVTYREGIHNDSDDVYFYDLTTLQTGRVYSGWLNTDSGEGDPSLNMDGSLLAFSGNSRADSVGRSDVYLYNVKRGLVELPRLSSPFTDGAPALSANGNFLAFFSERYAPQMGHLGNDIFLLELASGELLALPGLNSDYTDINPALSADAEFVLFSSNRPGGEGGADLYLYHRDLADNTRYIVSEAYLEDGYVTDSKGRPLANATVQITDGDGNALGETVTDSSGNFSFTVPAGVVMPISYSSPHGDVVTDEVGDDTYVPDFAAGNLKFTQVWVEDTIQSGMPSQIWFDVETETPKYNTFVKIYLVQLPTGSVDDLDLTHFTPDYSLTALTIESLGDSTSLDSTVTQGQDIVTDITYLSDDNRKAHVEHRFLVPATVADGTYAAVFSIGRFDYNPEDDALQSEDLADQQDNFLAAPASVIVGQPTLPNLRILSAELNSNSFELPEKRPVEESTPFGSDLTLNMEVESMAQDTELPVDVTFALNIDGQRYPLSFADNQGRRPSKAAVKTYPVTCQAETRDGYPEGDRCASLFRQDQQGYTYKLYLNGDAYDALAAKTADTQVELVIQLDPNQTVSEWENNTADNVKVMSVMYLAPHSSNVSIRSAFTINEDIEGVEDWPSITDYGTQLFMPLSEDEAYGNKDFGVGYAFNAGITYQESCFDDDEDGIDECDISGNDDDIPYPSAAAFDATGNEVYVKIFGNKADILTVDVGADFDGDQILCTWFAYDVAVIGGLKTWDAFYNFDGIDPSVCSDPGAVQTLTIWTSQDDDGNELYTVSKSKDYEKTFTVGTIPITVAAGATGDLGIRGDVTVDTTNTVDIEVGPYLELTGYAEGGVGTKGFNAGIGIELLVLGVDLPFHATLQVKPSYPLAIFTFEAPLIISTLDGKLYLYAKLLLDKYTYTILKWSGLEWEYALIDPAREVWAKSNQFVGKFNGTLNTTGALDYDWGSMSAFTAFWEGDFNFEAGTYTFTADVDDYLTVLMDADGDENYETTLFGLKNDVALDLAGLDDEGTLNGPTASNVDALSNANISGSMNFDGSNDYIDLSNTHPISSTLGTIEHWVKRSGTKDVLVYTGDDENGSNADNYDGFGNGDKSSVEIHTGIDDNGYAYFVFKQIEDSTNSSLTGSTQLDTNTWYHIAATYDYNGMIKLYVNGTLEAFDDISSENYGTRDVSTHDGANSYIGRPIKDTRYFSGSLDEVRIWNDVRSQAEIQANMDSQLNGDEAGLVAYYRFDSPDTATNTVEVAEDSILSFSVDYENVSGQADVALSWSKINSFTAEYFKTTTLDENGDTAVLMQVEDEIDTNDWGTNLPIDYEWGSGSPTDAIDTGSFSARWTGTLEFEYGVSYLFIAESDDGVRLYVDGTEVINTWNTNYTEVTRQTGAISLTEGLHEVIFEYHHASGDATAKLSWMPSDTFLYSTGYFWDTTDTINFDWGHENEGVGAGGPDFLVEDNLWVQYVNNFNLNFSGVFNFTAGEYDFIGRFDDGIRVYIDGQRMLDSWQEASAKAGHFSTYLDGYHLIELDYFEVSDYAVVEFDWSAKQTNEFLAYYYRTVDDMENDDSWDEDTYSTSGGVEPLLIRKESASVTDSYCSWTTSSLSCDWGSTSPTAYLQPIDDTLDSQNNNGTDSFGARWIGDFDFTEGVYVFTVKADDGVRLWVDDVNLMDEWNSVSDSVTYQEAIPVTEESHNLRIEYWENTGNADIAVSWTEISQDTFNYQYFNSTDLSGTPSNSGTASSINYSGGKNSARWVGVFDFEETDYTFTVNTDGGVRVYLDGEAIIDQWTAQSTSTEYTATVAMEEGLHSLKVEYFEGNSGSPAIDVNWLGSSEIAGNALEFDGVDDYIKADVTDWSGSFTVEGWVKTTAQIAYTSLFSSTDSGLASSFQIDFDGSGNLQLRGAKASSGNFTVTIGAVTGEWQHIAVTFDGTTVSTYLNGELQNTATPSFGGLFTVYKVGMNRTGGLPFAGEVDEFRIWNIARTQAEIQAYMRSTLNGDESNLTAYYQFDQSSGTIVTDTTGSYDATITGDPQWVTSDALLTEMAAPGNAMSFDGSDDYVALPNEDSFDFVDTDFTVETWVKIDSFTAQWQAVIAKGDDSWRISRRNNYDTLYFALSKASGGSTAVNGVTSVDDGEWHHVAAVADVSNGMLYLYLDGELEGSTAFTDSLNSSDYEVQIGANAQRSGRNFNGDMDEVRIWNVARSQAEIQAYMNRTLEGDESGLMAYYNFDEVTGSTQATLTDIFDNNDGTLNGDPTWVDSDAPLSKIVAPGNAMSFDGVDDYVEMSGYTGITGTNARTMEAWIKTTDTEAPIVSWGTDAVGEKWIFRVQDGNGTAGAIRVEVNSGYIVGSTVVSDGEWHHVAATFEDDGSPNVADIKLYVDGVLETTSAVGALTIDTAIGNNVKIGVDHHNRYFNGQMDEVRIWNVARSEAEIQADMNRALGSFESGLEAYYRFDQDSGTELVDVTSFDNDGTLNGSPSWVTSTVPMD